MSDLDTRPLKRTRLSTADLSDSQSGPLDYSSASDSGSSNLHRYPEIWFEDGSLVLVAGESAFRIYRGLIPGQSTVFADLFASSTSSSDEIFEGCPVIHLSDSAHDLVHLLRVLLPQSHIHYHTPAENPTRTFNELFAVIRLAHKYDVPQVLEQALASLHESDFVTPFTDYSRLPSIPETALHTWRNIGPHNIGVVNLARLVDEPSLLPLALYHCTYLGSKLLDGWTREDGSVEYLSDSDLRRCIEARPVLAHAHTVLLFTVFGTVSARCARPKRCAEGLRGTQRVLVEEESLASGCRLLRTTWDGPVSTLKNNRRVCWSCANEMLERAEKEQKKIFDKLPKIFGITVEGWGEDSDSDSETDTSSSSEDE